MNCQAAVDMLGEANSLRDRVNLKPTSTMSVCTGNGDDLRLSAWDAPFIEGTLCSGLAPAQIACTPSDRLLSGTKRGRSAFSKPAIPLPPDATQDASLNSCQELAESIAEEVLRTPPQVRRLHCTSASCGDISADTTMSSSPYRRSYSTPVRSTRELDALDVWAPARIAQSSPTAHASSIAIKPLHCIDFEAISREFRTSEGFGCAHMVVDAVTWPECAHC